MDILLNLLEILEQRLLRPNSTQLVRWATTVGWKIPLWLRSQAVKKAITGGDVIHNLTLLHGRSFAPAAPIVPGRTPSIERFPLGVQILGESSTVARADGLKTVVNIAQV